MKIEEDTIKKNQKVILDLLCQFRSICDKLNLKYTLSSGSLLGAVRHKGFIPWDDDADILMPREDYEIFIKKANELLPKGYVLDHYTLNKNCVCNYAKIFNNNTSWIFNVKRPEFYQGFSIDIFPLDSFDDPTIVKKLSKKTKFYRVLRSRYVDKFCGSNLIKKIIGFIFYYPIAKCMGLEKINKKQEELVLSLKPGKYTTADFLNRSKAMPISIFEEYIELPFEGEKFKVIKEYDTYLKTVYGDYMTPLPENKRKGHFAKIVDCEKPYTYYVKNKKSK